MAILNIAIGHEECLQFATATWDRVETGSWSTSGAEILAKVSARFLLITALVLRRNV
jgi:hypothetical protein